MPPIISIYFLIGAVYTMISLRALLNQEDRDSTGLHQAFEIQPEATLLVMGFILVLSTIAWPYMVAKDAVTAYHRVSEALYRMKIDWLINKYEKHQLLSNKYYHKWREEMIKAGVTDIDVIHDGAECIEETDEG